MHSFFYYLVSLIMTKSDTILNERGAQKPVQELHRKIIPHRNREQSTRLL